MEKDGKKLATQCKHYVNNVGNDVVQQIISGKTFEQARFASPLQKLAHHSFALLGHKLLLIRVDDGLERPHLVRGVNPQVFILN